MSGYPTGLEASPHGDALLKPGKDYELRGNEIVASGDDEGVTDKLREARQKLEWYLGEIVDLHPNDFKRELDAVIDAALTKDARCVSCGGDFTQDTPPIVYCDACVPTADAPPPSDAALLREALLAHENKVVDMTLACGEKLDHVYHMTAIVRKSREALLALAAHPRPDNEDAIQPSPTRVDLHGGHCVCNTRLHCDAHPEDALKQTPETFTKGGDVKIEDAPGGPTVKQIAKILCRGYSHTLRGLRTPAETKPDLPCRRCLVWAEGVRDALNRLKGDENGS